ncbi:hypothetical protein L861_02645 [Litchfieldella anticariensis FP35 = DSM 16096]|uniref:Uncharacterized protein n=1 Tax=Litchfieldella anticariensis (strain DSM 16096 / CECT 5854 / CIP 108499 / LMG 22089 / FP35) TaxID=1121939 RepID=S2KQ80_LITA3|nr:hypothetical protein L861_02645 [Halomonas anticariensis FP35 = DSM 16096]
MLELKHAGGKGEYVPPAVLQLGSSADITAAGTAMNSDDGENPDTAFDGVTSPS